jgi:hypothetical protein
METPFTERQYETAVGVLAVVLFMTITLCFTTKFQQLFPSEPLATSLFGWVMGATAAFYAPKVGTRIIQQLRQRNERPDAATDTRAAVRLVDVILSLFVLVATISLAPTIYRFIGMVTAEADPFSELLLMLVVPMLFLALIISVGVSARRGA